MSQTEAMERYKRACDFNRPVDKVEVALCLKRWMKACGGPDVAIHFLENEKDILTAARAAWAARDARDVTWIAVTYLGALENGDKKLIGIWKPLFEAMESGAWLLFITDDAIHVCLLPEVVKRDPQNRLHRSDGPAFVWNDIRMHYWHGVLVPDYVIEQPSRITVADIDAEENAEVRRVKIERFDGGMEGFVLKSGAEVVHRDGFGTLYRRELKSGGQVWAVKVVCPSTGGEYVLRVNSRKVKALGGTARAAVASTWRHPLDPTKLLFSKAEEYAPLVET